MPPEVNAPRQFEIPYFPNPISQAVKSPSNAVFLPFYFPSRALPGVSSFLDFNNPHMTEARELVYFEWEAARRILEGDVRLMRMVESGVIPLHFAIRVVIGFYFSRWGPQGHVGLWPSEALFLIPVVKNERGKILNLGVGDPDSAPWTEEGNGYPEGGWQYYESANRRRPGSGYDSFPVWDRPTPLSAPTDFIDEYKQRYGGGVPFAVGDGVPTALARYIIHQYISVGGLSGMPRGSKEYLVGVLQNLVTQEETTLSAERGQLKPTTIDRLERDLRLNKQYLQQFSD